MNAKHPAYSCWKHMRGRCHRPKHQDYKYYGARGIKVCRRWDIFTNFVEDMGPRPGPGYSIDRRNNNGNYTPSNCYWATRREQGRNTRAVKLGAEEVRQIRVFLRARIPQTTIARVYKVSSKIISAINTGVAWA